MKTFGATKKAQDSAGKRHIVWLAMAMLVLSLCLSMSAHAEPAAQPPAQQSKEEPGFFGSIAQWFERGFSKFKGGMQDAKSGIDDFNNKAANAGKNIGEKAAEVGKGAADAMKKLPSTRVIDGREICDVSPNGAPDCRHAAQAICSSKGFASGTSVDFVSAEKCPRDVWMGRRKAEPGECVTETFVTRAMCQ